jgi:hypothetical protein
MSNWRHKQTTIDVHDDARCLSLVMIFSSTLNKVRHVSIMHRAFRKKKTTSNMNTFLGSIKTALSLPLALIQPSILSLTHSLISIDKKRLAAINSLTIL